MSIGSRIQHARKGANVSQRDLAKQVGLSAMMISKYENDQSVPDSEKLLRFSKALKTNLDYFFRSDSFSVELLAYRKHAKLGKKKLEAIKVRIQDWLERYLEVEDFFPQEKIQIDIPSYKVVTLEDIEAAAVELREAWHLGLDPIENLIQLLEDKGLKVGLVSGFDDFDACTFTFDGNFVIASKSEISGDRQRFNVAHELGHLVLAIQGDLDDEKAANRFAGAFLVPAEKAVFELGMYRRDLDVNELHLLKHKYGLSMQGWIYRAKDLGIISENTFRRLFKHFRANYWHREEPGKPYPSEQPERMEKLIYRAL
ncbi:MAG: XRE family transcriptional regulator, partial [Chloroflexota bacterium]|nr:XRE family transcriptional regulator [Chloroflexota bacterium]